MLNTKLLYKLVNNKQNSWFKNDNVFIRVLFEAQESSYQFYIKMGEKESIYLNLLNILEKSNDLNCKKKEKEMVLSKKDQSWWIS